MEKSIVVVVWINEILIYRTYHQVSWRFTILYGEIGCQRRSVLDLTHPPTHLTQAWVWKIEGHTKTPESTSPTLRTVCGFFNVPQSDHEQELWDETYPRRPESLTIRILQAEALRSS